MAINFLTDIGQVRNLIGDVDEADFRFSDARIEGFLAGDDVNENIRLAAADAQDTTASDQALLLKVVRMQNRDLETDGAKLADALRAHAKALRAEARRGLAGTTRGKAARSSTVPTVPVW